MKTNRLKTAFKKLIDTIKEATSRFPYAIALGVSTAVTMIVFIHLEEAITQAQSEWFQRAAMTLIMGVPIALSIKMIEELFEKQSRWIIHVLRILGLALLTIYFFFGLPHFEMVYIVRYIGFNIFLWGMFLTIPFFKRRELIEVFTFKVGWRLLITGFYCAIIFGGVSGILFSLKELLDVPITSEHYQDAIFIIAGIILPTFFFVGIPKKEDVLPSKLTKFFRILLIYVIMPILTAYTVVLYLYFVKMLFEQALPKNIISNLVLWYSIIGIVILYLARPETNKSRWAKLFDRWFLRLLYIPLAMMFISVFIRVNQYGITEPRYYVIIGGVWILAMTTYIMLKNPKKRKNVIIPLSAAVLALLTVIGPWSAFGISKMSQNNRLEEILSRNDMIVEEKLAGNNEISEQDKNEASSIISYFNSNHKLDDIRVVEKSSTLEEIEAILGFEIYEYNYIDKDNQRAYYRISEVGELIDIKGYDYLYSARDNKGTISTEIGKIEVENIYRNDDNNANKIVIKLNENVILDNDLSYYGNQLMDKYAGREELTLEELSFVHDTNSLNIKIIFYNIEYSINEYSIEDGWADYVVLIGLK